MKELSKTPVKNLIITESYCGQRLDNFLTNYFRRVPKSRIYRSVRKGEVRINGKRVQPLYKLQTNDVLRIPPLKVEEKKKSTPSLSFTQFLQSRIIYEDEGLMILNKPSGWAVHGGSGISVGMIENLKHNYSPQIELVHRLDKETSGCLLIAKKRNILKSLHEALAERKVKKTYLALLKGNLPKEEYLINLPLTKKEATTQRTVKVDLEGKSALTRFRPLQRFKGATLVEVELQTGRMHQIRVHASAIGHPIAGDEKYGDKSFNKSLRNLGLKRLFLHAAALELTLPTSGQRIGLCACMDEELIQFLRNCL